MNRDHLLGFPPVLEALYPSEWKSGQQRTPVREKLPAHRQATNRLQDIRENQKLTMKHQLANPVWPFPLVKEPAPAPSEECMRILSKLADEACNIHAAHRQRKSMLPISRYVKAEDEHL